MDAEATFRAVFRAEASAQPRDRSSPRLPTIAAVAALHIALIAALAVLPSGARLARPTPAYMSIPVIFLPAAQEPAAPPPQMLASSALPAPTADVPATLAPLAAMTLPPRPERLVHRRATARPAARDSSLPSPSLAATAPIPHPVTVPATAAPAAAPPDTLRAMASWEARIRQAVQDAAIYPPSARLLHRQGSAQVRFDYDRGATAGAMIAQSSHFGALDDAALAAVTRAAIPDPPAELGPQKRTMLVWVQFTLLSEE